MLVPHQDVDKDGEDFANVADDRKRGGGDHCPKREGEVAHP